MNNPDLSKVVWRKSTYSSGNGQCVEVAAVTAGFAVRDSKNSAGGQLFVDTTSWCRFLSSVDGRSDS